METMASKTKSVALEAAKPTEISVNFGNVEALKLKLLNEINQNLKKILEKLEVKNG